MHWFTWDSSVNVVQLTSLIGFLLCTLGLIVKFASQAATVKNEVSQIGFRLNRMDEELKRQTDILISLGRQDERIKVVEMQLSRLLQVVSAKSYT